MRIVSLVPNGTEILFALGAGEWVVGVSHECDYPREARQRRQLTGSALPPGLATAAIDAAVSAQLASGESLYTLEEAAIAELAPDLIVTQNLCPVCAVSTAQVEGAVAPLARCPEVLALDPKTLEEVFASIVQTGDAIGKGGTARGLVAVLKGRLARLASAGKKLSPKPRVAALEWLDPPFAAGHWVPEMITAAGGVDLFATPGAPSRRLTFEDVAAADPDVIVVMPCGFDEDGAAAQMALLREHPVWNTLRAVEEGRAVPVDANGLFSRPGPRLVDGVERLVGIFSV